MVKRKVFFSFHYKPDGWRAGMVRNIGTIEGNSPITDNDWETIKKGGDEAIKKWIRNQIKGKDCTIVLIGTNTAGRKWIDFEIVESWKAGLGIVGIHIHGLKNKDGYISKKGINPFNSFSFGTSKKFSEIVKCYDPAGNISKERYAWIEKYILAAVEEAIKIRSQHK